MSNRRNGHCPAAERAGNHAASLGQVYVNAYGAAGNVTLPFGGTRHSGFGREKGLEAIREYTGVKTVAVHVAGI